LPSKDTDSFFIEYIAKRAFITRHQGIDIDVSVFYLPHNQKKKKVFIKIRKRYAEE
jgi:hypothetical protein